MTNSQGGSYPWQSVRQVSLFSLALCLANRATRFCDGNAHSPMIGPYFCTMPSITWDFRICVVFGSPSVVLVSVSELVVCTQLWRLRHLLTLTGFLHWTHGHIEGSVDVLSAAGSPPIPKSVHTSHLHRLPLAAFPCHSVLWCFTASARSLTSTTSLSPTSLQTT